MARYVPVDDLKRHLSVTSSDWDVKLGETLDAVKAWIDAYCCRSFDQTTEERLFDTENRRVLTLGVRNDLVSVDTLATDTNGDGTHDTTWATSDYQLLPINPTGPEQRPYSEVRAVGSNLFPSPTWTGRRGLVSVTGTWGWPEVPEPVREATLIQAARVFKRREAPEGVLGFDQFGTVRVSGRPDPDVQQQLADYIHPRAVMVA